jgi:hypothetical protein
VALTVLVAIIAGYSAGVVGGYLLSKAIIRWLSRSSTKPRFVALLGSVGGLTALIPAFFLSTFVEGTLGGGSGEAATQVFGLGSWNVPIGLGLALTLILALITGAGALVGAVIARLIPSRPSSKAAT